MPEKWTDKVAPELLEAQRREFEQEHESILRHREQAKQLISELLAKDARILIFDMTDGGLDESSIDPELIHMLQEDQFGGRRMTYGENIRHFLGFDAGDPRAHIWDVPTEDIDFSHLPYPDVWITTGGRAMPSMLHPGNETESTPWLKRAVGAMNELATARVPGLAICLGHQLWEYSRGAIVGQRHPSREFGTSTIHATPIGRQLQLLVGFWDDEGETEISSSHSEGVITPPPASRSLEVIAFNNYSPYQAAAHALRPGQTVLEAQEELELVHSIQNHPEITAKLLRAIGILRDDPMKKENIDQALILLKNTPRPRNSLLNLIKLAAARYGKRK